MVQLLNRWVFQEKVYMITQNILILIIIRLSLMKVRSACLESNSQWNFAVLNEKRVSETFWYYVTLSGKQVLYTKIKVWVFNHVILVGLVSQQNSPPSTLTYCVPQNWHSHSIQSYLIRSTALHLVPTLFHTLWLNVIYVSKLMYAKCWLNRVELRRSEVV